MDDVGPGLRAVLPAVLVVSLAMWAGIIWLVAALT
jgi:hypothetical protein